MSRSRSPYKQSWWVDAFADGIPARPQGRQTSDGDTFDVVIVGGGAAGHTAAIFAAELGLTAVMLEAGEEGGGTAYKSGAGMWVPDNSIMTARGRGPNRDWAMQHMARLAYPSKYDPAAARLGLSEQEFELITVYYETGAKVMDELRSLGLALMEFPSFTGNYEAMVEYHNDLEHGYGAHLSPQQPSGLYGGGPHLTQRLAELAAELGVDLLVGHRVVDVVQNSSGEVVGVRAATADGENVVRGRRGVIFTSGGYPHNRKLVDRFFPAPLYGSCAVLTARGDFIEIAERLGAELGNMGMGWGTEHPLEVMLRDGEVGEHIGVYPGDSVLMVNATGNRVVNEKLIYHERSLVHFEQDEAGGFPNHLTFLVYDDFIVDDRTSQPNRWPNPEPHNYWVISGDTLDELSDAIDARLSSYAGQIGGIRLAPDFKAALAKTVSRFNDFARRGVDEDFHRGETDLELDWTGPSHVDNDKNPTMYPLSDGPYHCIILAGSVLDTDGGPKATPDGRILRHDGTTIPGLFGAGNCVASAAGEGYWSGGSTLGPALTFAYLAAHALAAEPVRELG